MNTYSIGDLRIEIVCDADSLSLLWFGRSDAKDPVMVLGPLLDTLRESFEQRATFFDFRSFEYMNSSTIHPLLNFLQTASNHAPNVVVRYDGSKTWQRLSFRAIETLARPWGNITFEG